MLTDPAASVNLTLAVTTNPLPVGGDAQLPAAGPGGARRVFPKTFIRKHLDSDGLDLLGVLTGSEGLLGVITEVTVRILQKPETARVILVGFPSSEDAVKPRKLTSGWNVLPVGELTETLLALKFR